MYSLEVEVWKLHVEENKQDSPKSDDDVGSDAWVPVVSGYRREWGLHRTQGALPEVEFLPF